MCKLIYFRNWKTLESVCKVTAVEAGQNGECIVRFDQTPFYPTGGGQPSDCGTCSCNNKSQTFAVKKVEQSKEKNYVSHYLEIPTVSTENSIVVGDECKLSVDPAIRLLHSRIHSAGHVIDAAVKILNLDYKAHNAYHYPGGASVTFSGWIGAGKKEEIKLAIQQECDKLVEQDLPVFIEFANDDPEDQECNRTMRIGDIITIPCGGTHVDSLKEVGKITIRKIEAKNGTVRVGYAVN